MKVAQSCPTLCDPMDYTVHGILQARVLEWVAFPFSGDLPDPGIEPRSLALQADSLPTTPIITNYHKTRALKQHRFTAENSMNSEEVFIPRASLMAHLVKNPPVYGRPGLGRSPGEGKGNPLQYSGLDNFMDCIAHRVTKSWT